MGFVWRAVAPGLLAMFVALASPVPVLADNPVSIDSLLTRAAELKVEGKLVEAVPLVREALRRAEARYGVDARATQEVVSNLGRLYLELDRIDEAGVQFERVFARTERVLGKSHTDYPRYASWLGRIRFLQERYAEAKILFTATRDGYAKLRGPDNREVAHGESNLGEIAERNVARRIAGRDLGLEEALFRRAIQRDDPVRQTVGAVTHGPGPVDTLRETGELLNQNESQHGRQGPELTDQEGVDFLVALDHRGQTGGFKFE